MSWGKIKIDKLDQLFSRFIRLRAKNRCQRCLKIYAFESLQCAHFHGRANKKVRHDEDNAVALDYGCHQYLDSHALEKVEFFRRLLGEKKFEALNQRANWPTLQKIDKKAIEIYLKAKINGLRDSIKTS